MLWLIKESLSFETRSSFLSFLDSFFCHINAVKPPFSLLLLLLLLLFGGPGLSKVHRRVAEARVAGSDAAQVDQPELLRLHLGQRPQAPGQDAVAARAQPQVLRQRLRRRHGLPGRGAPFLSLLSRIFFFNISSTEDQRNCRRAKSCSFLFRSSWECYEYMKS